MRITFHGAAGEVTGSCYEIETAEVRFLFDCGMFQGGREAGRKNLGALRFDLHGLDFVILSHAHIDHSGLLPRLFALGYRGPVHVTPATAELLRVMLLDSAHIQEKESELELRRRHRQGRGRLSQPALLYTVAQAQACLKLLHVHSFDSEFQPAPGVNCRFRDAGHILGAAITEIGVTEGGQMRRLVFSGDLGQPQRPVLEDPVKVDAADVLFVESTYGDRLHKTMRETEEEIVDVLDDTLKRRQGNVIVPAFAVGRTQEILYILVDLVERGRLPPLHIYVDSPMALAATRITLNHLELLDARTRQLIQWQRAHPDRVRIDFIEDVEESIALNRIRSGAIIVSASGMCDAGRIKYHLVNNLARRECSVLITGFQAAGTLGRRLVDGARRVRIFGEEIPVRARVHTIGGLSAHADRDALMNWLSAMKQAPQRTFVVHGESAAAAGLAQAIHERLGWRNVAIPEHSQVVEV